MTPDHEWGDKPPVNEPKPMTAYELGEIAGREARAKGTYTAEERARFINTHRTDGDSYTRGFIAGLRS